MVNIVSQRPGKLKCATCRFCPLISDTVWIMRDPTYISLAYQIPYTFHNPRLNFDVAKMNSSAQVIYHELLGTKPCVSLPVNFTWNNLSVRKQLFYSNHETSIISTVIRITVKCAILIYFTKYCCAIISSEIM